MQPKLISIIVPVYKVEPYLRQCVDSILGQTYSRLEVILVDDGSPDRCGAICDEYAARDPRVKAVHKPNGGLSSARNAGLEVASGDFIGYVDSDDYIAPDMYEQLIASFAADTGVVATGIHELSDGRLSDYDFMDVPWPLDVTDIAPKDLVYRIFVDETIEPMVWNKLYRADLVRDLRFFEGRNNEDTNYMHLLTERLDDASMAMRRIPQRHYYYRRLPTSISLSRSRPLKVDSCENMVDILADFKTHRPQIYHAYKRRFINCLLKVRSQILVDSDAVDPDYSRRCERLLEGLSLADFTERLPAGEAVKAAAYASLLKYLPGLYVLIRRFA